MKTGSLTGCPDDELDDLLESYHASIYTQTAAIRSVRLFDLDHGWNAAIPRTIDGQNLNDELTQLGAQACIGHNEPEMRMTLIHFKGLRRAHRVIHICPPPAAANQPG